MKIWGTGLLVLSFSVHGFSAELPAEDRDWHAFVQKEYTNVGMQDQTVKARAILDGRMLEILTEMKSEIDLEASELLDDNQQAWRVMARSKCLFLSDVYRGGSHAGLAYGYGFIHEQVLRIAELKVMRQARQEP